MAAISAAQPPPATMTTLTPPNSDPEDRSWDYEKYQRTEVRPVLFHSCRGVHRTPYTFSFRPVILLLPCWTRRRLGEKYLSRLDFAAADVSRIPL